MTDEFARALPDPPPSRPARRAAAIAMALEQYDGAGARSSTVPSTIPLRPQPWWRVGRPQVAALASVALVALIAVPLAMEHPDGRIGAPRMDVTPSATSATERPSPGPNGESPTIGDAAPGSSSRTAEEFGPPAVGVPSRSARADAVVAESPAQDVVSAAPAPLVAAPPPPPPAPAPEALADSSPASRMADAVGDGGADVVVTGSRISRRAKAAFRRGDWNACTVIDPERSLRGCSGLVRIGRKGDAGAAAARVAEGLALGWREDWSGAVEAFDRALALQPRLAIAYLNRGLAHDRLGDSDAALADLDLAVRHDPSARSHYARSRVRRARGDAKGARADENRAVDLDPEYARVVRD